MWGRRDLDIRHPACSVSPAGLPNYAVLSSCRPRQSSRAHRTDTNTKLYTIQTAVILSSEITEEARNLNDEELLEFMEMQ